MPVQVAAEGFELHVERGGEQIDLHVAAAAAVGAPDQCGEDSQSEQCPPVVVDDRRPRRYRGAAGIAGRRGQPGEGLGEEILPRPIAIGSVAAVPAGRSVDDRGVQSPAILVAEPQLVHGPRPEVLHHHVRGADQTPRELLARLRLEVQRQASLVAPDVDVIDALSVDEEIADRPVALECAADRLHADHVGAQIGQVLGGRRSHQHVVEAGYPEVS